MNRREPGRVRERLAERLLEIGVVVDPYDLWTQEGFYRGRCHDLARWGTYDAEFTPELAAKFDWHDRFHLSSWDTMTNCTRYGVAPIDGEVWRVKKELCGGFIEISRRG